MNSHGFLSTAPPAAELVSPARTSYNTNSTISTQIAANALRSLNSNGYDPPGKPQPYMAPVGWTTPIIDPRNTTIVPSSQNIIRQSDGASDQPEEQPTNNNMKEETQKVDDLIIQKYEEILKKKDGKKSKTIPQLDGKSDNSDDDDDSDNAVGDEVLDSDLDDDDDAEPETENFVLCQYEKVTRVKNKRKTNLKDGIMHLNGRDSVFHKATGEFDW